MENDNRPLGLRMNYESMWSLVDDVSTLDIKNEIIRFKEELTKRHKEIREKQSIIDTINNKLRTLEQIFKQRYEINLIKNFNITEEHKILVRNINFSNLEKIPYISGSYEDMAKMLNWELPNEYVSKEQEEKLKKLIDEIPIALNEMINN